MAEKQTETTSKLTAASAEPASPATAGDANADNASQNQERAVPNSIAAAADVGQASTLDGKLDEIKARAGGLWQHLRNLSLKSKLLMMLLPAALISMGSVALIGYHNGKAALTEQAVNQLTTLRTSKKRQIETYFQTVRDTFGVFGEDVAVVSALAAFSDGYRQLGRQKLAPDRKKRLEDYYIKDYLQTPGFADSETPALIENFFPRSDRGQELQALFIGENPHRWPNRAKLLDHPASNPYTLAHFAHHSWFRDLVARLKLDDLMLVESDTGNVVYTVTKEVELGNSYFDGPFSTTNAARLVRDVIANHRKGMVKFTDFENYAPSNHKPAMFMATPVYASYKLVGVLLAQIPVDEVNRTVNGTKSWREDGLGDSGLAYIAGPSMLLRNDHRAFIEAKQGFLADAKRYNVPEKTIDSMDRANTTVLRLRQDVEGVRRAFAGQSGHVVTRAPDSKPVFQSYTPLAIPDLNWVLVAQMNSDEVLAPQTAFNRNVLSLACAIALLTTMAASVLASRFLRPINALVAGIDDLRAGQKGVAITKVSDDEFGKLTDSFNVMSKAISERDDIIQAKSQAYENLLHRIFPDIVADRMKKGEAQVVDTFQNVTVIYASAAGFLSSTETLSGVESAKLLNEIIDRFDAIADAHGIERVKNFGEHYIAACGLSVPRLDHAQRTVSFADALGKEVRRIAAERNVKISLRAGLATGQVHAGLVGNAKFVYDMWGKPLNLARRIVHEADLDEIRISEDLYKAMGEPADFKAAGTVQSRTLGPLVTYGRAPKVDTYTGPKVVTQAAE